MRSSSALTVKPMCQDAVEQCESKAQRVSDVHGAQDVHGEQEHLDPSCTLRLDRGFVERCEGDAFVLLLLGACNCLSTR